VGGPPAVTPQRVPQIFRHEVFVSQGPFNRKIPKGVSLPPDLVKQIQQIAELEFRSFSSVTALLIRRGIDAERTDSNALGRASEILFGTTRPTPQVARRDRNRRFVLASQRGGR